MFGCLIGLVPRKFDELLSHRLTLFFIRRITVWAKIKGGRHVKRLNLRPLTLIDYLLAEIRRHFSFRSRCRFRRSQKGAPYASARFLRLISRFTQAVRMQTWQWGGALEIEKWTNVLNGKINDDGRFFFGYCFFHSLRRTRLKKETVLTRVHVRCAPHGARLNDAEEERERSR